jgi:hypothetical protein
VIHSPVDNFGTRPPPSLCICIVLNIKFLGKSWRNPLISPTLHKPDLLLPFAFVPFLKIFFLGKLLQNLVMVNERKGYLVMIAIILCHQYVIRPYLFGDLNDDST